jgi:PQQ-dependent catabolism-associated CXXCW motif protein
VRLILSLAAALVGTAALATAALAQVPATRPGAVPEPAGLYDGAMHGYVPGTIKGGTVLDTKAFLTLLAKDHPVLIDVADKDRKPPSMSKDTPWLPQHRTIPGAVWLQGAGNATGDTGFALAFRTRLASLTGGDRAKPIVVFCHPDCWASYNAAKRMIGLGYTNVSWYPEGMEGWQNEHETSVVKPDAAWTAALPNTLTR